MEIFKFTVYGHAPYEDEDTLLDEGYFTTREAAEAALDAAMPSLSDHFQVVDHEVPTWDAGTSLVDRLTGKVKPTGYQTVKVWEGTEKLTCSTRLIEGRVETIEVKEQS